MKIGIAHFTDIHFSTKTNIDEKLGSCINAIKNDFYGVSAIYFVLSGDISFSGKSDEFTLATIFFNKIKQLIEKQYPHISIKMVIVPGNHDINVERDTQIRRNSIENIKYSSLGTDNSVVDTCLSAQEDFWTFYSKYNKIPQDKLFYQICDLVGDTTICFHCINTSWVSQKNEKVGSLFFPVSRYDDINNKNCDINIGVWHHPYNWFNPSTAENNKKEFQLFTERIASVHLLGHEHQNEFYSNKNIDTGKTFSLLSGKIFSDDSHPNVSGFETIVVEIEEKAGKLKKYDWKKPTYCSSDVQDISFAREKSMKFAVNPEFYKALDEIKIPLVIGDRKKVKLSEIYVFPDLEKVDSDVKILDNYHDSEHFLQNKYGHSLITGENQIGKSSLLNIIYQKKYQEGKNPLLITGKEIKELDFTKIIKRAFRRQYLNGDENFDAFMQLEADQRILLIDDYQNCKYNASSVYAMLKEAMNKFGMMLLTIDSAHSMLPALQSEFKDIGFYNIKPLGYNKKNKLIERYLNLKKNKYQDDDELAELQEVFDKVQGVLGDKLIPSYPIYILSILQSLEYNSLRQNETSFGYCYQTLIHYSLFKAEVRNEDIDTYFNFLSELAYEFIRKDVDVLSDIEMIKFYTEYKEKFIIPSYSKIVETLKSSRILIFDNDENYFGYDYILYYLSAKKIADIIHLPEGKRICKKLFDDVHIEQNGNILVFITHHCKDISFIEESLLNSMVILSDVEPITLALDDPFYDVIKEIASDVSKDVLEINKNPKVERDRQLEHLDKQEIKRNEAIESRDGGLDSLTLPIKQSFRSIEILGQILRNRKGSLPISQLKSMIIEVYTTGFRTIGYSSQLLEAAKTKIILMVNDNEDILETNKGKIEKIINSFIMMSSLEACLAVFSKIMTSMGLKDLKKLFNDVAEEIGTPAAKLLSFGINSYYGNITEAELKTIVGDLKGNPVALRLLRGRVKSYVYSKNLDIKIKQKFAKLLDMEVPTVKYQDKAR